MSNEYGQNNSEIISLSSIASFIHQLLFCLALDLERCHLPGNRIDQEYVLAYHEQLSDEVALLIDRLRDIIFSNPAEAHISLSPGIRKLLDNKVTKDDFLRWCDKSEVFSDYVSNNYRQELSDKLRINNVAFNKPSLTRSFYIFTPILQISIGHFGRLVDLCELLSSKKSSARIYIIRELNLLGSSLIDHIHDRYIDLDIVVIGSREALRLPVEVKREILSSMHYIDWLSLNERLVSERCLGSHNISRFKQNCSKLYTLHLRTGNYKNDRTLINASSRNTCISNYRLLINELSVAGYSGTQVTADLRRQEFPGVTVLHVIDKASAAKQWDCMDRSEFIVGNASGITHLSGLTKCQALLVDFNSFGLHYLLAPGHMIAPKKLKCTNEFYELGKEERFWMLAITWTDQAMLKYAEVVSLTPEELAEAAQCFLEKLADITKPWDYTVRRLASEVGINTCTLPDRNLSRFSYRWLRSLLI